jgi:hypothetical protein
MARRLYASDGADHPAVASALACLADVLCGQAGRDNAEESARLQLEADAMVQRLRRAGGTHRV